MSVRYEFRSKPLCIHQDLQHFSSLAVRFDTFAEDISLCRKR